MSLLNTLTKEWKSGKDIGLLLIRFIFAFALIYGHGWGKITTIFSGQEIQFMDPIGLGATTSFYLAAFAEFICALLLIFGLCTRFASIVLIINFLVIVGLHAFTFNDAFEVMEPRIFYLFTFVALFFSGSGKYSLDHLFFNKRNQ
ncbi:MAG: DoxX family protein [Bacteroidia bacterium]|nr:DoxX family protein [Bacteroidia bacterium]